MRNYRLIAGVLVCAFGTVAVQAATTITFETLSHGDIVNNQFQGLGVTISVDNTGGGPDLGVIFDSNETFTADPDLEDPWSSAGNLAPTADLGNMLIIQEHGPNNGVITPDDEGSRPAGSIWFDFGKPINSFGFDLIDVEGPNEFGNDSGYFAAFFDMNGAELARVGFSDFITNGNPFFDSTVGYGNNSANRIAPITAAQLGVAPFGHVEINLGGSAAVDNITFTVVPLPPAVFAGLGLLGGLGGVSRWRKRQLAVA